MSPLLDGISSVLISIVGTSKDAAQAGAIALASVAQQFLLFVWSGLALDIGRWKEAKLRQVEADTAQKQAQALKTIAEAVSIANSSRGNAAGPTIEEAAKDLQRALSVLSQHGGSFAVDTKQLQAVTHEAAPQQNRNETDQLGD